MLFVPQDNKCKYPLQMYKSPQTTEHQAETLFYKPPIALRVSLALKAGHLLAICNQIHKLCLSGGRGSFFPNLSAAAKSVLEQLKISVYLKKDYTFQLQSV